MDLVFLMVFIIKAMFSFTVSTLFIFLRKPNIAIVSMPAGDAGLGAIMVCARAKTLHLPNHGLF